jgi:uncharacterized RDD family membrane protein YckC
MDTAPLNYATPNSDHARVGFLHRFLAGLIDAIVVAVLVTVPNIVLSRISPMLGTIVSSVLTLAYYSLEVFKAQSLGKMVLKLKITKQDGSAATQDQLVRRYAFKQVPQALMIVGAVPFLHFVFGIAGLAALGVLVCSLFMLKPEKLALYDQLFGTAVFGPAKVTFSVPTAADLKVTPSELRAATAAASTATGVANPATPQTPSAPTVVA